MYYPDGWKIVKLVSEQHGEHHRVAAGWSGGYLTGDSWKLNSGIVDIVSEDDHWDIHGDSGSVYRLTPNGEDRTMALGMAYAVLDKAVADGSLTSWSKVDAKDYLPPLDVITDEEQ